MKRSIVFALVAVLAMVSLSYAAGTVVETQERLGTFYVVTFTCTGDGVDGSIPDTAFKSTTKKYIQDAGLFPFRLEVENDSGDASVTDNSDVYIIDDPTAADPTVAYDDHLGLRGVDLLDDDTLNRITLLKFDPMVADWYLRVSNQAAASGVYTVKITFVLP